MPKTAPRQTQSESRRRGRAANGVEVDGAQKRGERADIRDLGLQDGLLLGHHSRHRDAKIASNLGQERRSDARRSTGKQPEETKRQNERWKSVRVRTEAQSVSGRLIKTSATSHREEGKTPERHLRRGRPEWRGGRPERLPNAS